MKTTRWIVITFILLPALLALCFSANAKALPEKKISKKELPPAILAAFQKAYPKATLKGFSEEKNEEGIMEYEIESREGEIHRDLLYRTDGQVIEIEETCVFPDVVMKAIGKEYPGATVGKTEKIMRGTVIEYEAIVKTGKEKTELVLDPSGKIIKAEKKANKKEKEEGEEGEQEENSEK